MSEAKKRTQVPAIRFKGFTDAWEQQRLGKILNEYNERAPKDSGYEHVSLTREGVVPKTERYNRDALVTNKEKEYRVTHKDDICYNPANLKFGVICRNTYGNAIFSPIYVTFMVVNADSRFVGTYVTRDDFISKSLQFQQGTVYERMSVSPESLCNMEVFLPTIQEQNLIGTFFETFDTLLTLRQRELNKLKQIKKGLLQGVWHKTS